MVDIIGDSIKTLKEELAPGTDPQLSRKHAKRVIHKTSEDCGRAVSPGRLILVEAEQVTTLKCGECNTVSTFMVHCVQSDAHSSQALDVTHNWCLPCVAKLADKQQQQQVAEDEDKQQDRPYIDCPANGGHACEHAIIGPVYPYFAPLRLEDYQAIEKGVVRCPNCDVFVSLKANHNHSCRQQSKEETRKLKADYDQCRQELLTATTKLTLVEEEAKRQSERVANSSANAPPGQCQDHTSPCLAEADLKFAKERLNSIERQLNSKEMSLKSGLAEMTALKQELAEQKSANEQAVRQAYQEGVQSVEKAWKQASADSKKAAKYLDTYKTVCDAECAVDKGQAAIDLKKSLEAQRLMRKVELGQLPPLTVVANPLGRGITAAHPHITLYDQRIRKEDGTYVGAHTFKKYAPNTPLTKVYKDMMTICKTQDDPPPYHLLAMEYNIVTFTELVKRKVSDIVKSDHYSLSLLRDEELLQFEAWSDGRLRQAPVQTNIRGPITIDDTLYDIGIKELGDDERELYKTRLENKLNDDIQGLQALLEKVRLKVELSVIQISKDVASEYNRAFQEVYDMNASKTKRLFSIFEAMKPEMTTAVTRIPPHYIPKMPSLAPKPKPLAPPTVSRTTPSAALGRAPTDKKRKIPARASYPPPATNDDDIVIVKEEKGTRQSTATEDVEIISESKGFKKLRTWSKEKTTSKRRERQSVGTTNVPTMRNKKSSKGDRMSCALPEREEISETDEEESESICMSEEPTTSEDIEYLPSDEETAEETGDEETESSDEDNARSDKRG